MADQSPRRQGPEQRRHDRHPYDDLVALRLDGVNGDRHRVLCARDVSPGGMSVTGRDRLPVGATGVVQIVRRDGRMALVGVEVRHSRYAGPLQHVTGLSFVRTSAIDASDLVRASGRMVLMDPLLRGNES